MAFKVKIFYIVSTMQHSIEKFNILSSFKYTLLRHKLQKNCIHINFKPINDFYDKNLNTNHM